MMFGRDALRELCDYTDFTWAAYGNAVRALPPDALARAVKGSGWPALRVPLLHIACAWDDWLAARLGVAETFDVSPESITRWDEVQRLRDRTRGWLRRVLDETSDDGLRADSQPILPGTSGETRVSVADVLAHILLHERGHHGDVTTLLSALGAQPPGIDYLTYEWFKRRKR